MPARTNLITNPSAVVDSAGWTLTAGVTRQTTGGNLHATCWQIVGSAATNSTNYMYPSAIPVTPGQTVTISVAAKRVVGASNLRIIAESPLGTVIAAAGTDTTVTLTGAYARYSATFTVPSGVTTLLPLFSISCVTINDSINIADVMVEVSSSAGSYFDGATAPAHWTGTANASTSVMPAVDVTVDSNYRRVGVTLSGWSKDAPVTVYRVHPDTSQWAVRATLSTSSGQTFTWDYEAPFQQGVSYYAMDGTGKVVSATATLNFTDAWLRVPGLPSYDMAVTVIEKPQVTRTQPRNVLRPIGRTNPIVLSGTRGSPEFELRIRTYTDAQANALTSALAAGATFLVLVPQTRTAWQYVAVADVIEEPVAPYSRQHPGDEGEWATWRIPCTVVDSPVGGLYGDPTASYAAIASGFTSYAALMAAKATYLDVLKGV